MGTGGVEYAVKRSLGSSSPLRHRLQTAALLSGWRSRSGLPRPLEMDVCALKPQAKGAGVELQLGGGFWQRRVPDPLTPASAEHFHQGHMRKLQLQLLPPSERSAEGNGCENETAPIFHRVT
ncbi:hypothetical protein JZ751_011521 [Albula glossodonta]|uniref:Uncharacterized protein n=1 Tax=Albula glossodonta TaxID=121402 RepID=A0A8T2MM91_9TELE|nr:hypothetical protein JZ751_011521 [Albula glossodonta]